MDLATSLNSSDIESLNSVYALTAGLLSSSTRAFVTTPVLAASTTQTMTHPSNPSLQFRNAMQDLTHEWGFVVVRTAYAEDDDEAQWALALRKLQACASSCHDGAEMDPKTFSMPVIADSEILRSASYSSIRLAFNTWVADFCRYKKETLSIDNSEEDAEWPSDIRRDAFIVVDGPALASLLRAPQFEHGKIPDRDLEPWVAVVDAKDPETAPYHGGGPYLGFTRAYARVLGQLFDDLDSQSLARLSPVRAYDGQIPLYDGSSKGKLVDPIGGVDARYKFPQGTPRGADGARAMLKEIERALGGVEGTGK